MWPTCNSPWFYWAIVFTASYLSNLSNYFYPRTLCYQTVDSSHEWTTKNQKNIWSFWSWKPHLSYKISYQIKLCVRIPNFGSQKAFLGLLRLVSMLGVSSHSTDSADCGHSRHVYQFHNAIWQLSPNFGRFTFSWSTKLGSRIYFCRLGKPRLECFSTYSAKSVANAMYDF